MTIGYREKVVEYKHNSLSVITTLCPDISLGSIFLTLDSVSCVLPKNYIGPNKYYKAIKIVTPVKVFVLFTTLCFVIYKYTFYNVKYKLINVKTDGTDKVQRSSVLNVLYFCKRNKYLFLQVYIVSTVKLASFCYFNTGFYRLAECRRNEGIVFPFVTTNNLTDYNLIL